MGRLINTDVLKDKIAEMPDLRKLSTKTLGKIIKDCPTVDAVEVVFCKDCKYAEHVVSDYHKDEVWCSEVGYWKDNDWYCAGGRKRDDNHTTE